MSDEEFSIHDGHPLALELASLRAAVQRYQHEAYNTSLNLQRHALDTSQAIENARALERENARLKDEVAVLRATPDVSPHPAALQVPELTLALRRLSDKLTLTEETLLVRTTELAVAHSDLAKASEAVGAAHALAAQAQAREEEGKSRERELKRLARASEEERKMADLVVQEYADLVRNLEGRPKTSMSSVSSLTLGNGSTLVDGLAEGKSGLRKLLEEFNRETEKLEAEKERLHSEILLLLSQLENERKGAEQDRLRLAEALVELDKHRSDDNTAAKMVSRYMKFSQSSTNSLQTAMENLRTRHVATTATLNTQIDHFQKTLLSERRQTEQLRHALDELSEDISREAYGRRREVALRLAFLGREEGLAEALRRWIRKARESVSRILIAEEHDQFRGTFEMILEEADALMESLNGQPPSEGISIGSVARIITAQEAVSFLTRELQVETDRRLHLQQVLAHHHDGPASLVVLPPAVSSNQQETTSNDLQSLSRSNEVSQLIQPQVVTLLSPTSDISVTAETMQIPLPVPPPEEVESQLSVSDTTMPTRVGEPASVSQPANNLATNSVLDSAVQFPTGDAPLELSWPQEETSTVGNLVTWAPTAIDVGLKSTSVPLLVATVATTSASVTDPSLTPPPESQFDIAAGSNVIVEDILSVDQLPTNIPVVLSASDLSHSRKPVDSMAPTETSVTESPNDIPTDVTPLTAGTPATSDDTLIDERNDNLELESSNIVLAVERVRSLEAQKPPLLAALTQVKRRYDDLQRAFRDCHLALQELKQGIAELPRSDVLAVVQTAVERLDDFNEDARVELEIRVADEERVAAGYETLLSVPGAISDEVDEAEMEREIRAFADGSDQAVSKATQQFTRKLDDLEHDIASIKLTVHDIASTEPSHLASSPTSPAWSWAAGLLGSSHPPSPAPTFGSIITSPRLRHSSSASRLRKNSNNFNTGDAGPFASLGLRIPMPAHVLVPSSTHLSPTPSMGQRPRVSSAMYMLGLGPQATSFGLKSPSSTYSVSRMPSRELRDVQDDSDMEDEESDSDVE